MNCTVQILQLAHLLEVSADVARDIERDMEIVHDVKLEALRRLADQTDRIAEELARLADGSYPMDH